MPVLMLVLVWHSLHSVCLIRVIYLCIFVYLLGRFSEVNIGYQSPLEAHASLQYP